METEFDFAKGMQFRSIIYLGDKGHRQTDITGHTCFDYLNFIEFMNAFRAKPLLE
jgi:hypothetical protein